MKKINYAGLSGKDKNLINFFTKEFETFLARQQSFSKIEIISQISVLPLFLSYWPKILYKQNSDNDAALKRLSVLVALLKTVSEFYSCEYLQYCGAKLLSAEEAYLAVEGCAVSWEEKLTLIEKGYPLKCLGLCHKKDSEYKTALLKKGLVLSKETDSFLIFDYLDFLVRKMKYVYKKDIEYLEKNANYGFRGNSLITTYPVRLYSDEEELIRNVKHLKLYTVSNFLFPQKISFLEISRLIKEIDL